MVHLKVDIIFISLLIKIKHTSFSFWPFQAIFQGSVNETKSSISAEETPIVSQLSLSLFNIPARWRHLVICSFFTTEQVNFKLLEDRLYSRCFITIRAPLVSAKLSYPPNFIEKVVQKLSFFSRIFIKCHFFQDF